jgi:hypothetical protein
VNNTRKIFGLLMLFVVCFDVQASNFECSPLAKQLNEQTFEGPMYCSNKIATDAGFDFVSLDSVPVGLGEYMIKFWNLSKSNVTPIFSSAKFKMPFKDCCQVVIKKNSVYIIGSSSDPTSVLDETYQIKLYDGAFRVIGYNGCEKDFNSINNDNFPKKETCADINLITGSFVKTAKVMNRKMNPAKGKIVVEPYRLDQSGFFDKPQKKGSDIIQK